MTNITTTVTDTEVNINETSLKRNASRNVLKPQQRRLIRLILTEKLETNKHYRRELRSEKGKEV